MFSHQHSTVLFIVLVAIYVVLRVVRHWANIFEDQSVFVLRYWYYRRSLAVNSRAWLREVFIYNWLYRQIARGYFPRIHVYPNKSNARTDKIAAATFPGDQTIVWFGPALILIQWFCPTSAQILPVLNFND